MFSTAQAQATDPNLVSEGEEEVLVFESMTIDYGNCYKKATVLQLLDFHLHQ